MPFPPLITACAAWLRAHATSSDTAQVIRELQAFASSYLPGPPLSDAPPLDLGAAAAGSSPDASRGDHRHAHGAQLGGSLHAVAVAGGDAGFLSGADKTKIDGLPAPGALVLSFNGRVGAVAPVATDYPPIFIGAVPIAAVGAPGGVAPLDGGGLVPLARLPVIDDAVHGARGGGTLHALATAGGAAGFLSGADKAWIDAQFGDVIARPECGGPGVTTRAPGVVFEGSQMIAPFRLQVQRLRGRLTGFTTAGAGLTVAIYQVPGGAARGNAVLLGSATLLPVALGAQDLNFVFAAPVTLERGYYYLLFGRPNAVAGVTLRVWTIGTIERLTNNVAPGDVPITFATAIPSTAAAPAVLAVPGALVASTLSPSFCGRMVT